MSHRSKFQQKSKRENNMKKLTALFLAFVLALSLPLIFATNEFDTPGHDHDFEHEQIGDDELLRVHDYYCSTCGNYTNVYERCVRDACEKYDSTYHLCKFWYQYFCSTCNNPVSMEFYTDGLYEHDFVIETASYGDLLKVCYTCLYVTELYPVP